MKIGRLGTVFILSCSSLVTVASDLPRAADASRSVSFAEIFSHSDDWTFREWENGFLVGLDQRESGASAVVGYDSTGRMALKTSIKYPGADDIALTSATFDTAKHLIVAGGSSNSEGVVTNFIAQVHEDGSIEQLLRVNPFVVRQLCSAEPGKVWAIGSERDADRFAAYPILREFGLRRGQLRTAIPRNTTKLASQGRYGNDTMLRCSKTAVVLYSSTTGELFKYDLRKDILQSWKITRFDFYSIRATGLGIDDSGQIFASLHRLPTKTAHLQTGLYVLNIGQDGNANWEPIPGTVSSDSVVKLLGVEHHTLVYMPDARDPLATTVFTPIKR
ncbi:MAG TPA: hypothetical protein VFU50_14815 [Terriglobales bacterium]|nr:hypothetical protein [Terriglobales bacterium]